MEKVKKVSLFLFISISSLLAQTSKTVERVKVSYDAKIETYALALARILNVGVIESEKRNYEIPSQIELKMIYSDRRAIYDNGGRIITLEYDSLSCFTSPSCGFYIASEIDRFGSIVLMNSLKIKDLKKVSWMNKKFRASWSLYFASNLIDNIYDITSDTIWPTPYNFKKYGIENLKMISNNENSLIYYEINAWIDLGNIIKFDTFPAFFAFFRKNGLSKEAFVKSLYKFMDAEDAREWEKKYMQYAVL